MAAEPMGAETRERPAPASGPGRLRLAPLGNGRGATTAAVAFSALLHGALAATILMWPNAPSPSAISEAITVTLVPMALTAEGQAAVAASPAAPAAAQGSTTKVARDSPATRIGNTGPPEPVPRRDKAMATGLSIAPASGPTTLPLPTETISATPTAPRARTEAIQSIPPPPRRPAFRFQPSPRPAAAPTAAPPPGFAGPTSATDSGRRGAAAAAANGGNGSTGPAPRAGHGESIIGPRFVMGSAANPRPRYPFFARRQGFEGRVVLRVFVEADGRVGTIDIRRSSAHAILDDAAVDALRRWRFTPATRSGVPVASWIDIPVTFRLRD